MRLRETRANFAAAPSHFMAAMAFATGTALMTLLAGCSAASPVDVRPVVLETSSGPIRGWVARVDVSDPRVQVLVTEPLTADASVAGADARLETVTSWGQLHAAVLATNANYFAKISHREGEPAYADILGLDVSQGVVVSPSRSFSGRPDPALVFLAGHRVRAGYFGDDDLGGVVAAVAGIGGSEGDPERGTLLVDDRVNLGATARVEPDKRHPRTAAGVSRDGRTLWLVAIDGRQPDWSVGMTLPELAGLMIDLGSYDAVNLDGGGSTTFVYQPDSARSAIHNRPSDGTFRPVANQLGFRLRDVPVARSVSTASAALIERD